MAFARNIDMALLAIFGRLIIGRRVPIAYEVLDVHRFFLGEKAHHRFFRFLERWVLRQCDALIVSSEGYIENYFEACAAIQRTVVPPREQSPLGRHSTS